MCYYVCSTPPRSNKRNKSFIPLPQYLPSTTGLNGPTNRVPRTHSLTDLPSGDQTKGQRQGDDGKNLRARTEGRTGSRFYWRLGTSRWLPLSIDTGPGRGTARKEVQEEEGAPIGYYRGNRHPSTHLSG